MKGNIVKYTLASLVLGALLLPLASCAENSQAESIAVVDNANANTAAAETAAKKSNAKNYSIVNVSYDPTRELYAAYNEVFKQHWESEHDSTVEITQSHGGSGKQALEVANGNPADVVTLALEYDVKAVEDAGLIEPG